MSNTVTFYHNPMSRARTVHWMLEEAGAPYEVKLLDFSKREHKRPSFLELNPLGKLPTIVHDGVVVTEAAAICAYLADAFPQNKLAPRLDDPARGTYYRWMFFGASTFEPAVVDKMLKRAPTERTSAIGYGTFEDAVATMETALRHKLFLLGEQFSAVDLYTAGQLDFAINIGKAVEAKPIFMDYLGRCTDRPAYKRATDQLNELVKKLQANKA